MNDKTTDVLDGILFKVTIETAYDPIIFWYKSIEKALIMAAELKSQGYKATVEIIEEEEDD